MAELSRASRCIKTIAILQVRQVRTGKEGMLRLWKCDIEAKTKTRWPTLGE